ncbi:hypothetical protein [Reyranella sp.]|uniref:hypothetical protein n=1 Tax=Reyranella sp. TaxID=1929291 RepID=UPI003D0FFB60
MTWPLVFLQHPTTIAAIPAWAPPLAGTAQQMADALVLWVSCHKAPERRAAASAKFREWHGKWAAQGGGTDADLKTGIRPSRRRGVAFTHAPVKTEIFTVPLPAVAAPFAPVCTAPAMPISTQQRPIACHWLEKPYPWQLSGFVSCGDSIRRP